MTLLQLFVGDIYGLLNFMSFLRWLFIGIVVLGLIYLRFTKPDLPRPFRVSSHLSISVHAVHFQIYLLNVLKSCVFSVVLLWIGSIGSQLSNSTDPDICCNKSPLEISLCPIKLLADSHRQECVINLSKVISPFCFILMSQTLVKYPVSKT